MKVLINKTSIKAFEVDEDSTALYVTTTAGAVYSQEHERGDHVQSISHLAHQIKALGCIEVDADWKKL